MRVLVVEDEVDLARAIKKALESRNFACDLAADGETGLYNAESWDYDLIILDLMLPGIDGWTVLERLRKKKKTPVLILTARDAVPDKVRGLDGGADDYLTKPFELKELLARIRALTRRAAGEATAVLKLGSIEIDTAARTVRRGGKPVSLKPKEYALLELFALNRGRLVTRTMIYDHIYDENEDTLSNVVDVYVSSLRKKLGKDIVKTRRGEGYQVDV
ncbi:MAG: response regulator transcription factor [Planctomycetota bacterium]|jgi:two-component system OmpR family response regulator